MQTHSIFETSLYEEPVTTIVHDVFDTMLHYEIGRSAEDYEARTEIVTAAVFFAGARQGALILECTHAQALFFAARLMNIPEPAAMDDDARDSLGEIVNMIGGNLKSVLLPGVGLSMPSVLDGADYAYKICGANQSERISFRGELGPLWLTLVQMAAPLEPGAIV
jgi:chemotaxis protein CheX